MDLDKVCSLENNPGICKFKEVYSAGKIIQFMKNNYPYKFNYLRIYKIIKRCSKYVLNQLGYGCPEKWYQAALTQELRIQGFSVDLEVGIPLLFKTSVGNTMFLPDGHYQRIDLFLTDMETGMSFIIELKSIQATPGSNDFNSAILQCNRYLSTLRYLRVSVNGGFVINFPKTPTARKMEGRRGVDLIYI